MEWRDIAGFEGLYQVSDTGLVRSVDRITTGKRNRKIKGTILKQCLSTTGYYICYLCKDGKAKTFKVHRLIAKAFIENPNNLPCINHKDLNPLNNEVSNLEWCNQSYNIKHANMLGHKCGPKRKLTPAEEQEIKQKYKRYSRTDNQECIAKQYGVSQTLISYIVRNYL